MIRFACPNCKKVLKAPPNKGGVKTSCPACKTPVVVPNVEPEQPPVPTSPVSPPPVAKPLLPAVPVAKPIPPPVTASAVAVPPAPSRPPRSEPVVRECRGWAEFGAVLREEDEAERRL
ncbi:MAG: hypothetical protein ABGY75_19125, partial [Gemmataceae bacterium]